ncbi:hypothetical protein BIW11_03051 [Tropilaelaps mercedesae]|uniref:Uncharacterized protein n=1 Tax=Tropilaelaps mercedesae TaxID=418985 RepID=A0A1V9XST0_9ACAR|nr:hypothetical protein BIW11_03051 [Tropilaelaps mercedesae]
MSCLPAVSVAELGAEAKMNCAETAGSISTQESLSPAMAESSAQCAASPSSHSSNGAGTFTTYTIPAHSEKGIVSTPRSKVERVAVTPVPAVSKPVTNPIKSNDVMPPTSKSLPPSGRIVSANVVDETLRTTRGRPLLRATSNTSGRAVPAGRSVGGGPRGGQMKTIVALSRNRKERSENPKVSSQANGQQATSATPGAPGPKRRRMASFQHAFLMCGAKAEPVTPQQSKVTLLQCSSLASSRLRPLSNGSGSPPTILGRPGGPSIVRVSSVGAKRVAPPPVRGYLPARRPPYKQSVPRLTPAERDKLLTSQPSTPLTKRALGTSVRGGLRSRLADVRPSITSSSKIKEEFPSTSNDKSDKLTEMPEVIARMMQIHAPVRDDVKLPVSRPSFLNLQMRRDFATISSNGDVEGSAGQSTPTLLPTSYTVSVEKTVIGKDGSDDKAGQVKVRVPPLPPALKCGVFVVKHQEKTGVKLQPVPSLRGDAVAWLDPRGPFQKPDGSRGTGPYLMYARSEDKDTNRRRFACAHHGCRVTLTADMDTMLVLRRCGTFHRHENSEADLNKRRLREKLRKRLRLYDGTRTPAEVLREFPELYGQESEERQREMKKAAINIRRSPVDGEKIPRWGKQVSEKCLESVIGLIPEVPQAVPVDGGKLRKPRKKRKRFAKGPGRGRGRRVLTGSDAVHEEDEEIEVEDEFLPESPELTRGLVESEDVRPIIDTGNSVAATCISLYANYVVVGYSEFVKSLIAAENAHRRFGHGPISFVT